MNTNHIKQLCYHAFMFSKQIEVEILLTKIPNFEGLKFQKKEFPRLNPLLHSPTIENETHKCRENPPKNLLSLSLCSFQIMDTLTCKLGKTT